ncbi:TonB-dependent receptor [Nostoc ellipsosporum NOK]|nr:TonB-dependent receptor [Nostoc ellipsosporum NOK]
MKDVRNQLTFTAIVLFIFSFSSAAQQAQTVRGALLDVLLQTPIAGATVSLGEQQVITGDDGVFRFADVIPGSYTIRVYHVGYNSFQMENVQVNAGKETVLTITIEARVKSEEELIVRAAGKKNRPLNDMSVVSARAFSVEEVQKYAASVNDPGRMAVGFPGVMSSNDGSNEIVIRGNAPSGLIWRMEGVDIPNPNHFSITGSAGGGISILNTQLLSNSDFITGAFAAEYGNGISGVFDLRLRKGNNEKREYTLQAGIMGLNLAAEGPFSKKYKGSYLVNYRYSTLSLLSKIGLNVGPGVTNFQDVSYNISLPAGKAGNFTVFGFSGFSNQRIKPEFDSSKWEEDADRYSGKFVSNTIMNGVTHNIGLGARTNLRTALGYSSVINRVDGDYVETLPELHTILNNQYRFKTNKLILSSTLNHRFNPRNSLRSGIIFNAVDFGYYALSREHVGDPLREQVNVKAATQTVQAFSQWQHKFSDRLVFNGGLHYMRLFYNETQSVEPRASLRWNIDNANTFSLGYGLHSQLQTYGVYFGKTTTPAGIDIYPNRDLGFTRSHHYVTSFAHSFSRNMRLKLEVYYQQLFDVPVGNSDTSTLSTLNLDNNFITDELVNKGKGRNYGVELSLERYLHNRFYYTVSASFYQSKYTALDGIERNTRFNGGSLASLIAGKEFLTGKKGRTFSIDMRALYAGGYRLTPVDLVRSAEAGYTVFKEKEAFSEQNPAYFRTDLRLSTRWNRQRSTQTLSLDFQNVTNRQNVYDKTYDAWTGEMKTNYQIGLLVILNYKLEF